MSDMSMLSGGPRHSARLTLARTPSSYFNRGEQAHSIKQRARVRVGPGDELPRLKTTLDLRATSTFGPHRQARDLLTCGPRRPFWSHVDRV